MVELDNKYQIGERRFGINWVGAYTLYLKETLRFLSFNNLFVYDLSGEEFFLSLIVLMSCSKFSNIL